MPKTKQPDLTIIIVNYNGQFWLKKTLTSLKQFYLSKTKYQVETMVVDNASSDDSMALLKKSFRWVKRVELDQNYGFAKANNIGLKKASSKYVMLLNSDMEFTTDSNLDPLLDTLETRSDVGVITPKLILTNGQIDPACHRGEPTFWAAATYFSGLAKLFPKVQPFSQYHQTYKDLDTIHSVDACSGAAMIVRSHDLEKIGLLDERFFMYAEDLDWCRRFREAGYQILYYPLTSIIHHKNKSGIASEAKSLAKQTSNYFYDTMLLYYDKHYQHYPSWVRQIVKVVLTIKKGAQ